MSFPVAAILAGSAAYLIGSLPFGYLTARFVAGIDIRRSGSGNIGATNVARVLGAKLGMLVLLLDALKGLAPVLLLPALLLPTTSPQFLHLRVLCGVLTIIGHMFPCWLGFRGGKGVATALGVVSVLSWQATLAACAAFLISFALGRIVSLSSMIAAAAFTIWQLASLSFRFTSENWSLLAFSLAVPLLIILRHRTNLVRLLRGEEPRFRAGGKSSPAATETSQTETPNSASAGTEHAEPETQAQHPSEVAADSNRSP